MILQEGQALSAKTLLRGTKSLIRPTSSNSPCFIAVKNSDVTRSVHAGEEHDVLSHHD